MHQVVPVAEHGGAFAASCLAEGFEGFMGGGDGFVDVFRGKLRACSDDGAGGWVMDIEGLAGCCVFVFAVYIAFLDEKGGVVELAWVVS